MADAGPACVALVPMVQRTEWTGTASQPPSRPTSTFVTQLLATAEYAPQTRRLRRATAADARTAYSASQHQVQIQARVAGIRTRQTI
ncbi:hypothetical protein KMZ93_25615 [Bradyrhizobium sediminis]|uniref:Uncharacterized protein n=1 Tax=Bradyrhizobium sediminis TaxID=2840469 RepID=A0A975P2W0_9BRAD|nr:hypothetical protein KMZ93_25615 [Bradyrhizobium sediminis]